MKYLRLLILCFWQTSAFAQSALDYANPLLGTRGVFLYGRTTPFVAVPFGNTHWTACTRNARIRVPLYNHFDRKIVGFRATRKPAMWMGDYGHLSIMPAVSAPKHPGLPAARFQHRHEKSQPYFYEVSLNPGEKKQIRVAITASKLCGVMRIIFPKNQAHLLFFEGSQEGDSTGAIVVNPEKGMVSGWNKDRQSSRLGPPLPNFKGHYHSLILSRIIRYGSWSDGQWQSHATASGDHCGVWVELDPMQDTVLVYTGTSLIDHAQAIANLKMEVENQRFEEVREAAKREWEKYFERIRVNSPSEKDLTIFYSALYHCLLFPRQFSEYGRYYSAFDDQIHWGESYNDYSLWDTYRAQHPLLTLIAGERVPGMVNALLQMYEEGGYMPKWPNPTYTGIMIGTHADMVVADALVKGFKGIDLNKALAACLKDALVPPAGDSTNRWADRAPWTSYEARAGSVWYNSIGYVPCDQTNESVSNTLEYGVDDYAVARVAELAGNQEMAEMLDTRSLNYRNLFNPKTGFMSPKLRSGKWSKNPYEGFTEGSPWTYLFAAQHDIPGTIELLGGPNAFIQKLNKNFDEGHYIHENEPGHHYTYLYNYANAPQLTQQRVADYRKRKYGPGPHGLHGDDDCGQMSAWYIFSALGFYPVCPASGNYAIGTPLFPEVVLNPDPDRPEIRLTIKAKNVSPRNFYIQKQSWNGVSFTQPFLSHRQIMQGGLLEFEMGPYPPENPKP